MFGGADLRRAAIFHAVARAGGISAAAAIVGKSTPAIHADLRRFERDVGFSLMERAGRGLRLTPQGRTLFEAIGRALDDIGRVRSQLLNADAAALPLRIGAVTGFGRYRLSARLMQVVPTTRPILFLTGSHDEMLEALRAGRIDFAVTYRDVTSVPIESEPVAVETLVLAGDAPQAAVHDLRVAEGLRYISYDEYEYVFARWFDALHGRQPHALIRHDHCTELEEALASVAQGRGVTIAPLDACLAFGLPVIDAEECVNALFLCATGTALASDDAAMIRLCLAAQDRPGANSFAGT